MKGDKNHNVTIWVKNKKLTFPRFQFCPIPKMENWEIAESFILLQLLIK